ncbi:MAG: hypothetical protein QXX61_01460 [Ignisphaera sp.]|uniref:DUF4350 domain-containing protein n=1 Tax=Ignisphaera aggregans TaxID=334771 RepID=A0A832CQK7_9CREN
MLKGLRKSRVSKDIIIILVFAIIISFISILINMPSTTPYSPFNTGGNGYSNLLSIKSINVNFVKDARELNQKTLVIIPLRRNPGNAINQLVEDMLKYGTTIVILDEDGYSNNLLEYLRIKARVEIYKVLDEVSKIRSREFPLIELVLGNNTMKIATYRPSYIILDEENTVSVAKTSRYAYADVDRNGYYTVGESMGEYLIACSWKINNGVLWLVADLDLFANNLMDLGDNIDFLYKLMSSGKASIIVDYIDLDIVDLFKYWFNNLVPGVSIQDRISLALLSYFVVLVVIAMMKYVEKK